MYEKDLFLHSHWILCNPLHDTYNASFNYLQAV